MSARNDMAAVLLKHRTVREPGGPSIDCECGRLQLGQSWSFHVADELQAVVDGLLTEAAAAELEQAAERLAWTTEHDNEVVSVRHLYEHVARLRGELEPVTYDFPPSDDTAAVNPSKEQKP